MEGFKIMISIEVEEKPDANWNKRLINNKLGSIYQTKEWSILVSKKDQKPLFLKFVDEKGSIISQLLLFERQRFETKRKFSKILRNIPGQKKLLLTWSYGPVIFQEKIDEVFQCLSKFLISRNSKVLGWTHPLLNTNLLKIIPKLKLIPWATFIIDLKKSTDEIYLKIDKHSGRKNIERSIKRGVEINELNEKNLSEHVKLYNMEHSATSELLELDDMLHFWKLLKPLGYSGFIATKDDKTIGALLFSYFNKHIIEGGVARSKFDTQNNLYSQDLIKWKIIEWGVQNNMRTYNLAGVNPNPSDSKEKGIFRYKKKWGGEQFAYWCLKL